ncbi:sister chromatid cohesion protein-like protein Dcc1 [Trematosphaeria pertusa]|uniref:Sister chromatid cohesion protein-like protein Dcc1 n=1 Tax=Trematosphaeria pertusa TaxID=390896 RepID=A0A6A6IFF4_9PLEO|nr:sister chromatid cohesion protein-like protein Dcc1 [Trematosphaeria pertusa]KAF2248632.1 sister chromatid cohesion protein-like protein Dcc1 [Trematosphaeria pertusa]
MATQQDERGVPLSVAHELQQFRLVELPPEIAELLEAPNPPALSIKSQAPSAPSGTPNPKAAYAVLCTQDKTFQLRQVQTSNSLFVTQPALESHASEPSVPTTRVIASCTATLELHPADGAAASSLEELLPIYHVVGGEVDATENHKSKASIFADIALSDGQCEQAWNELVAFELAGSSYRPSASTLSHVWSSLNAAALAEGVRLESQFQTDHLAQLVEEEGYPATLAPAIFRRLAKDDQDTTGPWSSLDRTKAVSFVGKTLLEAKHGGADYLTADFLDAWKDSLPEAWRTDAELKTIAGAYDLPSSSTIRAKSKTAAATNAEITTPKPVSSTGKWHERFGKNRKK